MHTSPRNKATCCAVLTAAIVSSAVVATTSAALPDPPLAERVLARRADGWYKAAAQTMAFRARLAGVRIGADLIVALTPTAARFPSPVGGGRRTRFPSQPPDAIREKTRNLMTARPGYQSGGCISPAARGFSHLPGGV